MAMINESKAKASKIKVSLHVLVSKRCVTDFNIVLDTSLADAKGNLGYIAKGGAKLR